MAANRVIGADGALPWHLPADLRRFREVTMGHHLVMGRRTFASIGRPLPGRTTIVLTRDPSARFDGVVTAGSLETAIAMAGADPEVFVIGGEEVFRDAIPIADRILLTEIHQPMRGDTSFPPLEDGAWQVTASEPLPDPVYTATLSTLERVRP